MKKIAAVTIAAAALFAFAGCSDADDPNEMITGSNKKYEIDYTNTPEVIRRGYHSTAYKHAGAAVQLDFENASNTVEGGVMGLIFDLEEKDGAKSFNVIGVKTIMPMVHSVTMFHALKMLQTFRQITSEQN